MLSFRLYACLLDCSSTIRLYACNHACEDSCTLRRQRTIPRRVSKWTLPPVRQLTRRASAPPLTILGPSAPLRVQGPCALSKYIFVHFESYTAASGRASMRRAWRLFVNNCHHYSGKHGVSHPAPRKVSGCSGGVTLPMDTEGRERTMLMRPLCKRHETESEERQPTRR